MLNYYYNFILLCKEILKFEKNFKDINKIIKYNPNIKNDIENIFNDFLLEINKILNEKNNNNKNDYEKYLKLKIKIFNLIFDEFENFYCKNKNFINVFIENIINNNKINIIINLYIKKTKEIKIFQENWEKIFKNYENLFNINNKENENIDLINNIILNNFEINKKLLTIKNNINNNNNNLIDEIIESKQRMIGTLLTLKTKENNNNNEKEENIIKNNNNNNNKNNSISLFELELNNNNYFNNNNNNNKIKTNENNVNLFDIVKGRKEINEIKENFIMELESYLNKIKINNNNNENSNENNNENN